MHRLTKISLAAALCVGAFIPAAAQSPPAPAPASGQALTLDTPIEAIMADPAGRAVLDRHIPGLATLPIYDMVKSMSLRQVQPMSQGRLTEESVQQIGVELAALHPGAAAPSPAAAPAPPPAPVLPPLRGPAVWTTLGTNAGPIPNAHRSEPANLLRAGNQIILVDVGDGAADQLARAGIPLEAVQSLFISHHHFDHVGGLFALLGMRYQSLVPGVLTIYGPPGTRALVDALMTAIRTAAATGAVGQVRGGRPPEAGVAVVEMGDGATATIGTVHVTAAANSHFDATPAGPDVPAARLSLSYRFDTPGRSITYTGDTGPSPAVERLARGSNLLVSEIIDPEAALEMIRRTRPGTPAPILAYVAQHFRTEHLSPEEVGNLASRAGVGALVLTHIAIEPPGLAAARRTIAARYRGTIRFAEDLQAY